MSHRLFYQYIYNINKSHYDHQYYRIINTEYSYSNDSYLRGNTKEQLPIELYLKIYAYLYTRAYIYCSIYIFVEFNEIFYRILWKQNNASVDENFWRSVFISYNTIKFMSLYCYNFRNFACICVLYHVFYN